MLRIGWTGIKWLATCIAILLAIAYTAACLASSGLLLSNTLVNNGNWVSTKEGLGMKVTGASAFMRRTQALARCRLNLDAWNGYQEVLTRSKMKVDNADFDFLLAEGAYFALVFKEPDQFLGFRISGNSALKSVYFVARRDGEFIEQRDLEVPDFPRNRWNHFKFYLDDTGATIEINGERVSVGPIQMPVFCQPGFRGCERHVAIDNVVFREGNWPVFEDDFLNRDNLTRYLLLALVALTLLSGGLYCSLLAVRVPGGKSLVSVMAFNVFLALMGTLMAPSLFFALALYPSEESFARAETVYLYNHWWWRSEEISQQASSHKHDDAGLILFIGSSQTFGAGATSIQEAFVSRIQQRLDEETKGAHGYQCINAGMSGTGSGTLLEFYEQDWLEMSPEIVVLNLGANDRWSSDEEYASNLERFIDLSEEKNTRMLFVLEPYSWEWENDVRGSGPRELHTHRVMKEVAASLDVPFVDAHGRLSIDRQKGFLWWDFIHPTSFGHRLIADCIFAELRKVLAFEH